MTPMYMLIFCMSSQALVVSVVGFSFGAPPTTCKDMRPQHGYPPKIKKCPFDIKLTYADNLRSYAKVKERRKVIVCLYSKSNDVTFRGFMVQARGKYRILYGTFLPSEHYRVMTCSNKEASTATQGDSTPLQLINLTWVPPYHVVERPVEVQFYVTFVKDMEKSWIDVKSKKFIIRRKTMDESVMHLFSGESIFEEHQEVPMEYKE